MNANNCPAILSMEKPVVIVKKATRPNAGYPKREVIDPDVEEIKGIKDPKRCGACGCHTGKGFMQSMVTFRGHRICEACSKAWPVLDRYFQEGYKRNATWEEFLHPPKPEWDGQGNKLFPAIIKKFMVEDRLPAGEENE